ncbi:PIN domain-containing protein [Glacieibacterium frigidum]|uniref:Ribonuclease VapC n=1 Tax=Glacieibacterium frigidum TaxID=2593303 RepID=A0A552UEU8_9SPHN|nr:PIN domain-containing protein [Glacieibacterium frigidum]TRW16699.1 type II toxin-antitoxin system VapC family toxin [Glacieibacterium frigidum]
MIFDSCVVIDGLKAHPAAREIARSAPRRVISVVTRAEVLAGASAGAAEIGACAYLDLFEAIDIDSALADTAGRLRHRLKLKTPDALILATAQRLGLPIVTRDKRLASAAGTTPAYTLD